MIRQFADHEHKVIVIKGHPQGFKMLGLTGYCKICHKFQDLCRVGMLHWGWVRCSYCLMKWEP